MLQDDNSVIMHKNIKLIRKAFSNAKRLHKDKLKGVVLDKDQLAVWHRHWGVLASRLVLEQGGYYRMNFSYDGYCFEHLQLLVDTVKADYSGILKDIDLRLEYNIPPTKYTCLEVDCYLKEGLIK